MADTVVQEGAERRPQPVLRRLQKDDLWAALQAGWGDFRRAPKFGLFFAAVYVIGGWLVLLLAKFSGYHYLAYPLAVGFALIAPFVAAGFYDVSRRIEMGQPLEWGLVLGAVRQGGVRDLGWMALVTTFAFILWMDFAFIIYVMFYGLKPLTPFELVIDVLSTGRGLTFLLVGNVTGALIAFFVFSITVVSCPLLLDRDVDFVTAMLTSLRVVRNNPVQMLVWAFGIAAMLAAGMLTGLLGMLLVLPVLGHATWHLYRKAVEHPDPA